MKKWRTPILLVLAILDVAVIGGIGYIVVNRGTPMLPSAAPPPCAQMTLASLEPYLSPAVAWDTDRLTVMLTAFYTTPAPPEASAQLLWPALDGVRRAAALGCPLPPEITLLVQAHGQARSVGHVAQLSGADVAAWAAARLPEAQLILHSAYRRSSETAATTPTE